MNIRSITSKTTRFTAIGLLTLSLAAWVTPTSVYKMAIDNEVITMIKKKLTKYNDALPEDRVYLHFDKPFYEPGESIWFWLGHFFCQRKIECEVIGNSGVEQHGKGGVHRQVEFDEG